MHPHNYTSIVFREFSVRQNSIHIYALRTYELGDFHPLPYLWVMQVQTETLLIIMHPG